MRERQDRIETRLLKGLQEAVLQPEAVDYTLQRFEQELRRHFKEMSGELEQLRARKEKLEHELRNLAATAAETGPSAFLVKQISAREREVREIADQLLSNGSDSPQAHLAELREFVHSRLANIRRLLYADVERARGELARHVARIEMRPVVSGGKGYYVAVGEWDFLGTGPEVDRAPHPWGGGARLVVLEELKRGSVPPLLVLRGEWATSQNAVLRQFPSGRRHGQNLFFSFPQHPQRASFGLLVTRY